MIICVLYALVKVFMGFPELRQPNKKRPTSPTLVPVQREKCNIIPNREYLLGAYDSSGALEALSSQQPKKVALCLSSSYTEEGEIWRN